MGKILYMNRRQFLKRSAVTGASAGLLHGLGQQAFGQASAAVNPSDKITIGMIGVGARAQQLMSAIQQIPGAEIVAVCDAYKGRLERAVERTQGRAKVYNDYREILAQSDIQAVVVATPDHLHKMQVIDSLRAGKDVYIEKPMTYRVDEGIEIISEVKKTGRILQVGSQGISSKIQIKAREIIASGRLGQITMIRAFYNRNSASGAWIYPIPPDASPQTVDWERFLGPAPKRPFDLARFFRWRCYEDYSGGIATDLFVHLMTTIHFLMNAQMPDKVVAMGSLYRWKESRDVPDTINAILEYPEGFTVNLSSTFNNQMQAEGGFQILGTEASMILGGDRLTLIPERVYENNGWIVQSWPRALQEAYYKDPKVRQSEMPDTWEARVVEGTEQLTEIGRDATVLHMQNFFEAVKSRKQPVEDAFAGHRAASVAHLVNMSIKQKRIIYWDRAKDNVKV